MYLDRNKQYRILEQEFGGKVLSYITSDRQGFETQIAQDVIDLFVKQLDKIGTVHRLLLFLYTRGGDTAAAWSIVNLIRMYCDELWVIIPQKAHSAGTIISLGAEKIIMTKQATLGPIDPSVNTPLNPIIPNSMNVATPVSVETVIGYVEFAKEELSIKDDHALSDIMIKLSDYVHPLVLGQVYRSRALVKMLARKLLRNQVSDEEKVTKIIDFLCSDSGSHDYTINRREAKEELELNVDKPSDKQYTIIKDIYDNFADEMGIGQVLNPQQGPYAVRRAFIESIAGGSDYFITEGRTNIVTGPNGQPALMPKTSFEGWRHE